MPYDPYALDQEQKSRAYGMVWFGLVISIVLVIGNVMPLGAYIEGASGVIVGAYLIAFTTYNRFDEHFLALSRRAAIWVAVLIGSWLCVQGLMTLYEGSYDLGRSAAVSSLPADDASWRIPAPFNRAHLLASLSALAFHSGFLFHYRFGKS